MYLSPNREHTSFNELHSLALREIFVGEYALGFQILGRALAKTTFSQEDPAKKEHVLRGFCRAVREHFGKRERKRQDDDLDLERQARYRMRTLPRKRDAILATLRREHAEDEKYARRISIAVREMDKIVVARARRENELNFAVTLVVLGDLFS